MTEPDLSVVSNKRTRGSGQKLKYKFCLNIQENEAFLFDWVFVFK